MHWENERTGRIGDTEHWKLKRAEEKCSLIAKEIFVLVTFPTEGLLWVFYLDSSWCRKDQGIYRTKSIAYQFTFLTKVCMCFYNAYRYANPYNHMPEVHASEKRNL